eukprot:3711340-Rhodomonas_salina.1
MLAFCLCQCWNTPSVCPGTLPPFILAFLPLLSSHSLPARMHPGAARTDRVAAAAARGARGAGAGWSWPSCRRRSR